MTKLALCFAVAALTLTSGLAQAMERRSPDQQETYADQTRCQNFTKQWNDVAANRNGIDDAKKLASQGEMLCRAGKFNEGSKDLERALAQVGTKPM